MTAHLFATPYHQYADRIGEPFTILAAITVPDDTHDAEVLPMYRIRFATDGAVIEAWPEEVAAALPTPAATNTPEV